MRTLNYSGLNMQCTACDCTAADSVQTELNAEQLVVSDTERLLFATCGSSLQVFTSAVSHNTLLLGGFRAPHQFRVSRKFFNLHTQSSEQLVPREDCEAQVIVAN